MRLFFGYKSLFFLALIGSVFFVGFAYAAEPDPNDTYTPLPNSNGLTPQQKNKIFNDSISDFDKMAINYYASSDQKTQINDALSMAMTESAVKNVANRVSTEVTKQVQALNPPPATTTSGKTATRTLFEDRCVPSTEKDKASLMGDATLIATYQNSCPGINDANTNTNTGTNTNTNTNTGANSGGSGTYSSGTTGEGGLVPCGRGNNPPCTLCHLVVGTKGVIDWGFKVMTFFAIAIIVAMGILYIVSAGDDGMMKTAKGGIKASLIGFSVMLGAWVIINFIMATLAKGDLGIHQTNWYTFSCDTTSGTKQSNQTNGGGGNGGGGGGAACENIDAAKQRLSSGGRVCTNGVRPSCDTSSYDAYINKYAGSVPKDLIKTIIARESSCNPNAEASDSNGKSCGLMQVSGSALGCDALKDPETGIREGMKKLSSAYSSAQGMMGQYGGTVTQSELAAAIYNGGQGQSTASADCTSSSGWPTIPKWGCPINPGSAQFNACAIRDYACDVGAN